MPRKFNVGDRVRRLTRTHMGRGVIVGEIYTVAGHENPADPRHSLTLVGIESVWWEDYFALVEAYYPCTPAELFTALNDFISFIFRAVPMRVGDVWAFDGVQREVLAISGAFCWLSNGVTPSTGRITAVQKNYKRVKVGPTPQ